MLTPPGGTSLPVVKSFADCAEWSRVVQPYLPQLYALPGSIIENISDLEGLKSIYATTNPAISGLAFSIALFPIFLVLSEVNRNWSQVDRVWSILPAIYHVHYAYWARCNGLSTQRIDNVLIFSVIWSIRLTFNYWRRGGYQIGSEDYRWSLIKEKIGQPAFFLLNVLFTSSIQSVLLFAITTPSYLILLSSRLQPEMATHDIAIARILIALIIFEFFADQSQWNYHQAKAQYQKTAKVPEGYTRAQLDRGFNTTGFFTYSRHPNFAAEQAVWLTLYIWGAMSTGAWLNWTLAATVMYMSVFWGSTPLTERISAGKYPAYKEYQRRVGMFLPSLLKAGWNEEELAKKGQ